MLYMPTEEELEREHGIKKQMNLALAHYSKADSGNFEGVKQSVAVVRDHPDLLRAIFHTFDSAPYFPGRPIQQLHCLNMAAEYVQSTDKLEKRFMLLDWKRDEGT